VAPAYSSLIFGLAITFGSLAGLLANIVAGLLIKQPILSDWRRMFIIFAVVYFIGGLVYVLLGSAVPRKWAINVHPEQQPNADTEEGEVIPI
jgi:MFS family permease